MSPRKSSVRRKNTASKAARGLDGIQLAGIGLIVVVVAVLAWLFISSRQPSADATAPAIPTLANSPVETASPQASGSPCSGLKQQWSSQPPMTIDPTKQYLATVTMAKGGVFVIQLLADKAPVTVNSFVFLANQGFYNGVTFHRVLDGFMAQGGDPTGSGMCGAGYEFANEQNDLAFDKPGVVAMANSGPNTNGSQFFIMFGPYQLSESDYTIFGQVISGMDVVNAITRRDPQQNPTGPGDAMASVTISVK